ncbi:P-loop containing nucleoside triphosphate hydrolase protein [Dioscorea alata]|uniref:P-loop containing nucleoside triphosphate hydrolase protein n=1 Tax=Dioscorea alata TaxID=55571 RepID=A0ACB7UEU2_DIOAL|nr:P-loop containing nucleoside triphosphate hydrolase protein [Dioscorea alata]
MAAEALELIGRLVAPGINELLKKAGDVLTKDIEKELRELQNVAFPRLKAMIQTEQMTDDENKILFELIKEFENVKCEIEDAGDKIEYERLKQQSMGKVIKILTKAASRIFLSLNMSSTLKKLQDNVSSINNFYTQHSGRASNSAEDAAPMITVSDIPPLQAVFGRDTDIENIVNSLTEATEDTFKIVTIIGCGGVGKTELAKHICHHSRINVDLKLWVFFPRKLFEAVERDRITKELKGLREQLLRSVRGKRFLLVFDGIWYDETKSTLVKSQDVWISLCEPLLEGNQGSMLLITSRMEIVSQSFRGIGVKAIRRNEELIGCISGEPKPFYLKGLGRQDCLRTFNKHAFDVDNPDQTPPDSDAIANEIVTEVINNLEGIPLAAREAGVELRNMDNPQDRRRIKSKIIFEATRKSLMWSYRMLPQELQPCIRHLSLYPKGFKFDRTFLVLSWLAAGVITQKEGSINELEDVGHDCFNKLVMKRKILCVEVNNLGRYEEEISQLKKLRTLYLTCNSSDSSSVHSVDHDVLKAILKKTKRLRALRLAYCSISKLPDSIGRSKHLRFLDLSNSSFNELPKSVCSAYYLWYLDLNNCKLNTVPKNLNKLTKLRYLVSDGATLSKIPHIGRLTLLRELKEFHVKKEKGHDLGQLKDMDHLQGALHIINLEAVGNAQDAGEAMLRRKTRLEEFVSEWSSTATVVPPNQVLDGLQPHDDIISLTVKGYAGDEIPCWMTEQNSKLKTLELHNCPSWGSLPALGNIYTHLKKLNGILPLPSSLQHLVLHDSCIDDSTLANYLTNLTALSRLELSKCSSITSLPSAEVLGLLAKLEVLQVMDCQLLTSLGGILALPLLHEFNISLCPALVVVPPNDVDANQQGNAADDATLALCLNNLTSLSCLKLSRCSHITSLPSLEVFGSLVKLKVLQVMDCLLLTSLGGILALPFLQEFNISGINLQGNAVAAV